MVTEAIPILEQMAEVLKSFPNSVQVEGFTDNVPIQTLAFPSNWELSASRAASVVHLFMKYGVRPERMTAVGYGEYRPVADNKTSAGRKKNRRVVIVIPSQEGPRTDWDSKEPPATLDGENTPAPVSQPSVTPTRRQGTDAQALGSVASG